MKILKRNSVLVILILLLSACKKNSVDNIQQRNFKMGFSTWSYGPNSEDRANNYELIKANSDIYAEQIDDRIPWNALINGDPLPTEFLDDIAYRVGQKSPDQEVILSVSPLNTERSDLIDDRDGSGIPSYVSINDAHIEDALYEHIHFLVTEFAPNYLIISMESNEVLVHAPDKWEAYKSLMNNVKNRIKTDFPSLRIAESVTLHNWYEVEVDDPAAYDAEITAFVNAQDFAAISFYPFFKGQHKKKQFQKAFNFLHERITVPIAFTETAHLANDLEVATYELFISSNLVEQKDYLETLFFNANEHNYEFVIWWTYRDYDDLWETFPEEVKDVGKLWRDTGLEDENGMARPALGIWKELFEK